MLNGRKSNNILKLKFSLKKKFHVPTHLINSKSIDAKSLPMYATKIKLGMTITNK